MAQFPQQLFVKIEEDRFVAAGDPLYLAKTNEKIKLGVYQLVEFGEASGTVDYRAAGKVAK